MQCIARAYGGEPLERVVNGSTPTLVYVVHPSMSDALEQEPELGVGFPSEHVFKHDHALFERLRSAYTGGDREALRALWETASPFQVIH